jgi:pimeloyl-ACP methyl ester carboxylesterase
MDEQGYDQVTNVATEDYDVATEDYWLRFRVPPGLMPDPQFDGRPARLRVHRVRPVYENGKGPSERRAVVLIHGRTVPGPVAFDLRDPSGVTAPGGGALNLSVQKALARAGIDTFAPSLLGYGRSTRFDEGLNDPGNASLKSCTAPGPRPSEGCDSTFNNLINPLDQQGTMLLGNPLGGQRRAHSSYFRFARTDVWVRDIDQVIDDAIERARPTDRKVALVGYSVGGQHVGRTLYADNVNELLDEREKVIEKVSRVVFLNSLFGGSTDEPDPFAPPTFPLTLNDKSGSDDLWRISGPDCSGNRIIPGTKDQVWTQTMEHETVAREWGPPGGLNRAPTFRGYGWNPDVAGKLSKHTLVMQGLKDGLLPTGPATGKAIYEALHKALPESTVNKVLVQVECASHALLWEGCGQGLETPPERCAPTSGTPYGGPAPWAGPHATFKAALIEWIMKGTFYGEESGSFTVNQSGVVVQ